MHRKQAWAKRVKKERFKKKFLSRMQATRLLQTDSMGFRRLCILKGIYPRAIGKSKQKASGTDKQFYLAREIKWLVHDHLQEKIKDFGSWEKRLRRAKGMQLKKQIETLQSKKGKPSYQLAATIKERYPFFIDAVKDIDDAMSMIALYAFMTPEIHSQSTIDFHKALPSGLHEKAKEIVKDWMNYVARAQILTRSLISIKGYYYEAVVKGERVRWVMPHEYASKFPTGIQQYILISFLEFYIEMMRFVLFKLNMDLEKEIEEREKGEEEGTNTNTETFEANALENDGKKNSSRLDLINRELTKVRKLFTGFTFYISREVPFKHVSLIITACGGRVVTNYGPSITHYVVDRPELAPPHKREENIEYIQPQYVFDCMNARVVLPVMGYRIGETLPPHVSPFTVPISNSVEDIAAVEETRKYHPKIVSYVPARVHEIRKFIDPSYVEIDPENKIAELDGDISDDEQHAFAPEMDDDDIVSLSGDELEDATKETAWEDEHVTENVERSKLSAYQVKKQRELNLMNQPTKDSVALRRQQKAKSIEAKKKSETRDQRIKRKLADKEKNDAATKRMQLQVARKKSAKYYRMVNSTVQGNKKREDMLATKAKQMKEGKTIVDSDRKTLVSAKKAETRNAIKAKVEARGETYDPKRQQPKAKNAYKKLPKWVQ
eukprot:Tbor_TRINITY_DN4466_c0_g2::TRINITY_DN4466_c0_g2_i1::g.7987::m.7987/K14843/PES1, NOP7; pescadillo